MKTVTLGRTGITVSKNGFGALPIQRITRDEAAKLLRKAYDGGITLFDTARAYSDSEEKIGYAMSDIRNHIYITTKTAAQNAEEFWKDLETSLTLLKTDHVDVYQFHNPSFCPKPGDESGLYEAALKAREQGKIRFIGITNHRLAVAHEAIDSGLYDTLQFPFCYLCSEKDVELVEDCKKNNICWRVRPWTVTAAAPLCSAILANSTALTDRSSHPLRNLTVTGTGTARETSRMICPASSGFFIRALPPPLPAILGAGQPMLMSMMSGSWAIDISAARAMVSGSSPNSWMPPGCSDGPSVKRSAVFLF